MANKPFSKFSDGVNVYDVKDATARQDLSSHKDTNVLGSQGAHGMRYYNGTLAYKDGNGNFQEIKTDFYVLRKNGKTYTSGEVACTESLKYPKVLLCTVAGTTASSEPSMAGKDVGDSVVDGTVTWSIINMGIGGSKFIYNSATGELYPKTATEMAEDSITVSGGGSSGSGGGSSVDVQEMIDDSMCARKKSTPYSVGEVVVVKGMPANMYLECTTAGVTSSNEMSFVD